MMNASSPKKSEHVSTYNTLPDHVIEEHILTRLAVKPLLRFKCVSSGWLSMISSTKFAKKHFELWFPSHDQNLIVQEDRETEEEDKYLLSFDENYNLNEYTKLMNKYPTVRFNTLNTRVVGSCNGLLCVYNQDIMRMYVWNPVTNHCRDIFVPMARGKWDDYQLRCIGFGYVSSIDDYKIGCLMVHNKTLIILVFSLKTGFWIQKPKIDLYYELLLTFEYENPAFVGDTLYWIPQHLNEDENYIIGLDLVEEDMVIIPLFGRIPGDWVIAKLFRMEGCLALCLIQNYTDNEKSICHVWKMKEHGDEEDRVSFDATTSYGHCLTFDKHYNVTEFVSLENKYPAFVATSSRPHTNSVVDIANGLLCLYDRWILSFYVWNPATNQCRSTGSPVPGYYPGGSTMVLGLGFGFISSINDYRIGCVLKCNNALYVVYIYSLRTGNWEVMETMDTCNLTYPGWNSAFVDDSVYWAALLRPVEIRREEWAGQYWVLFAEFGHWELEDSAQKTQPSPDVDFLFVGCELKDPVEYHIGGLNLANGKFKRVQLMDMRGKDYGIFKVFEMNGCLTLGCVEYHKGRFGLKSCEFWMLKQQDDPRSWVKLFFFYSNGSDLLYLFETGKCLVSTCDYEMDGLLLHDPSQEETAEEATVVWRGDEEGQFFYHFKGHAMNYVESLVSPFGTNVFDQDGDAH
uniref:F-box associated beta-propeller type 1 domain-containing protein n=1 Tax=Chenopodium quinoa TaxID=63459 RepID=A0A803LE88_CHEQI